MREVSEWEIEEAILASQLARARERAVSPDWTLIDPQDGLPGLVWRYTPMATAPSLYDDIYEGPRWRYGLQYRGITNYMGCRDLETDELIPWIVYSGRKSDDPRFRYFGTYDAAIELSPFTCKQFSLVPLGKVV